MTRLLFLFSLIIVFKLKAHQAYITLQEALDMKYVKVEVLSLGMYQGYCMELQLKNLSKKCIQISIEAGRRLNSLDNQYQDILIVKEELIVVNAMQSKKVKVKGYCCQANNRCPNALSKYSINTMADTSLIKVARYLSTHEFENGVEQDAVWAVSESRSAATIATKDDSLIQPLRLMVASIKGEILPWYRIISHKQVSRSGNISSMPILLQGELNYDLEKTNYVTLTVSNEKGLAVCLIKSQWMLAQKNGRYKLDIPLLGLEKGRYTVKLSTNESDLVEREFQI